MTAFYGLSFDSLSYDNQAEVLNFIKARVDKMMGRTPKDIKDAVLAASNFVVADMLEAATPSQKLLRLMVTKQLLSHSHVPSTWQKKQMLQ